MASDPNHMTPEEVAELLQIVAKVLCAFLIVLILQGALKGMVADLSQLPQIEEGRVQDVIIP